MTNETTINIVNAELHALIEDFYESKDAAERTVGYIMIRQTDHLDGPELSQRLSEIYRALTAALTRFERERKLIVA